jgi:hypothetical protein
MWRRQLFDNMKDSSSVIDIQYLTGNTNLQLKYYSRFTDLLFGTSHVMTCYSKRNQAHTLLYALWNCFFIADRLLLYLNCNVT